MAGIDVDEVIVTWPVPTPQASQIADGAAGLPWRSISGLYIPIYVYGYDGCVEVACARVLSAFSPRFAADIAGNYLYVDAPNDTLRHLLCYMKENYLPTGDWRELLALYVLAQNAQQTTLEKILARALVLLANVQQKALLVFYSHLFPRGGLRHELGNSLELTFGRDCFQENLVDQRMLTDSLLRDLLARADLCMPKNNTIDNIVYHWISTMKKLGYEVNLSDLVGPMQRRHKQHHRDNQMAYYPQCPGDQPLLNRHVHFIGISHESEQQQPLSAAVDPAVTNNNSSSSNNNHSGSSCSNTATRTSCMLRFKLYCSTLDRTVELARSQPVEFTTVHRPESILNPLNKIVYNDNCVRYGNNDKARTDQSIQSVQDTLHIDKGVYRRGPTMFVKCQGCLLQIDLPNDHSGELDARIIWVPTAEDTFLMDIGVCGTGLVALFYTSTVYGEAIYTCKHFAENGQLIGMYPIPGINSCNLTLVTKPSTPATFFVVCPERPNTNARSLAVSVVQAWPVFTEIQMEPDDVDIRYDDYIADDLEGLVRAIDESLCGDGTRAASANTAHSGPADTATHRHQFKVTCNETEIGPHSNTLLVSSRDRKYSLLEIKSPKHWQFIGFIPHQLFGTICNNVAGDGPQGGYRP